MRLCASLVGWFFRSVAVYVASSVVRGGSHSLSVTVHVHVEVCTGISSIAALCIWRIHRAAIVTDATYYCTLYILYFSVITQHT